MSQASGSDGPKFLLDTNVWRSLAAGDLTRWEPMFLDARQRGVTFYLADLSLGEFLRVLPANPAAYTRVRDTLEWQDRLAGNQGLAEQWPLPLRIGLFEVPPPITDVRREINQLRRRMLKASSLAELRQDDVEQLGYWSRKMDSELASWVRDSERMQDAVRGNHAVPENEKRREDEDRKLEDVVNHRLPEILLSANRNERQPYDEQSSEKIRSGLREFLHHHSGLLRKLGNRQRYNFRKHRSDFVDCNLLAYCAAGYTLVTQDDGIRRTLKLGKCPSPRVIELATLEKALPR